MNKSLFCLALALPLVAAGEVYRSVGEDGSITFSDRGGPDAEAVELTDPNIYEAPDYPPPVPESAGGPSEATASPYRIDIVEPQPREDVRAPGGILQVDLDVSPAPNSAGHVIMHRLDDGPPRRAEATRFTLENLERGPHRLAVWVEDGSGNRLGDEQVVSFSLLRDSDLFHQQTAPGVGPGVQQAPRAPMAPQAPRPNLPRQYVPRPAAP
jgi:hypothetical protein